MLVVGFCATADAIKAVNNGDMLATVAQKPKDMGKVSIETAQSYIGNI